MQNQYHYKDGIPFLQDSNTTSLVAMLIHQLKHFAFQILQLVSVDSKPMALKRLILEIKFTD